MSRLFVSQIIGFDGGTASRRENTLVERNARYQSFIFQSIYAINPFHKQVGLSIGKKYTKLMLRVCSYALPMKIQSVSKFNPRFDFNSNSWIRILYVSKQIGYILVYHDLRRYVFLINLIKWKSVVVQIHTRKVGAYSTRGKREKRNVCLLHIKTPLLESIIKGRFKVVAYLSTVDVPVSIASIHCTLSSSRGFENRALGGRWYAAERIHWWMRKERWGRREWKRMGRTKRKAASI